VAPSRPSGGVTVAAAASDRAESDDVVSRGDEFGDDGRTEMAGRTGDENTHGCSFRLHGRVDDKTQSHHYSNSWGLSVIT